MKTVVTSMQNSGQDTSDLPRRLTEAEIASLRQDMKESSAWVRQELKRRRKQREIADGKK